MDSLPPNHDLGPGVLAELVILLVSSLVLVFLRSYARLRITKCWGSDDTIIVFAWIFQLINFILMTFAVSDGLGRHAMYISDPEDSILSIVKWSVFSQCAICACSFLTKLSICLMILRIQNTKILRITLWTMMSLVSVVTIVMIVLELVHCVPLRALWTPSVQGTCIPSQKVYNMAYVQSGFFFVADLCLSVSPIIILWNVKISKKRKVLICGLMSLGLVATICSALRIVYTPELLPSQDSTYAIVPVVIVVILEMGLGIIVACIPACMPLFQLGSRARKDYPEYGFTQGSRGRREQSRLQSTTSGEDVAWRGVDGSDTISLNTVYGVESKAPSV